MKSNTWTHLVAKGLSLAVVALLAGAPIVRADDKTKPAAAVKVVKTDDQIRAALATAAKDLLFTSESDYPFEAFAWSGSTAPVAKTLRAALQLPARAPYERLTVKNFFENRSNIVAGPDYGDEKEAAKRAKALRDVFTKELNDVRVYRVGEIQVHIVIVGKTPSGTWLGLQTVSIET